MRTPRRDEAARELRHLAGVGPCALEDLHALGIDSVGQLALQEPGELYQRLCQQRGTRVDVCCLDVFICAVAQARDPQLPAAQRQWWYWSRIRKGQSTR